MTTILSVDLLPQNPFAGSGVVAIFVTNSVPSYFRVTGIDLKNIVQVDWYPIVRNSIEFETRQMIFVDNMTATFMIKVIDNFLDVTDRGGKISFRINDGSSISFPVKTVGPAVLGRLWQSPNEGLIIGL